MGVFPGGSEGKESTCNAGDSGSIPGLGRSAGEGNGNPFQYSCLENPMDRRVWWATYSSWDHKELDTNEELTHTYTHTHTHTHTLTFYKFTFKNVYSSCAITF